MLIVMSSENERVISSSKHYSYTLAMVCQGYWSF